MYRIFVCVAVGLLVGFSVQAADSLAIRNMASSLDATAKAVETMDDAARKAELLEQWESELAQVKTVLAAVEQSMTNTTAFINKLREKSRSGDNQAFYSAQLARMERQSASLVDMEMVLGGAITRMGAALKKVREDPDVKLFLEAQRALAEAENALKTATDAIPASWRDVLGDTAEKNAE